MDLSDEGLIDPIHEALRKHPAIQECACDEEGGCAYHQEKVAALIRTVRDEARRQALEEAIGGCQHESINDIGGPAGICVPCLRALKEKPHA